MKRTRLHKMRLDRVDLVDRGANQDAAIMIVKRDEMMDLFAKGQAITVHSAADIDAVAQLVDTSPTDGQKDAGNYKLGHIVLHGLSMAIENPKGSTRTKTSRGTGKTWSVTMPAHYGYINRTVGADGDHVDAYIGPNPEAADVHVVDQHHAHDGSFDEHKAMIGFPSRDAAIAAYDGAFSDGSGPQRRKAVTSLPLEAFKTWLAAGDTKKPIAGQVTTETVQTGTGGTGTADVIAPLHLTGALIAKLDLGFAKDSEFEEDKHPRGADGKWTAGGGASKEADLEAANYHRPKDVSDRVHEAATREGLANGAIGSRAFLDAYNQRLNLGGPAARIGRVAGSILGGGVMAGAGVAIAAALLAPSLAVAGAAIGGVAAIGGLAGYFGNRAREAMMMATNGELQATPRSQTAVGSVAAIGGSVGAGVGRTIDYAFGKAQHTVTVSLGGAGGDDAAKPKGGDDQAGAGAGGNDQGNGASQAPPEVQQYLAGFQPPSPENVEAAAKAVKGKGKPGDPALVTAFDEKLQSLDPNYRANRETFDNLQAQTDTPIIRDAMKKVLGRLSGTIALQIDAALNLPDSPAVQAIKATGAKTNLKPVDPANIALALHAVSAVSTVGSQQRTKAFDAKLRELDAGYKANCKLVDAQSAEAEGLVGTVDDTAAVWKGLWSSDKHPRDAEGKFADGSSSQEGAAEYAGRRAGQAAGAVVGALAGAKWGARLGQRGAKLYYRGKPGAGGAGWVVGGATGLAAGADIGREIGGRAGAAIGRGVGRLVGKRDFSAASRRKLAHTGAAMPDGSFPIKSRKDVENAVHLVGRAADPAAARRHIIARARSIGATGVLPADWIAKAFDESAHPRDTDGRFADLQGTGIKPTDKVTGRAAQFTPAAVDRDKLKGWEQKAHDAAVTAADASGYEAGTVGHTRTYNDAMNRARAKQEKLDAARRKTEGWRERMARFGGALGLAGAIGGGFAGWHLGRTAVNVASVGAAGAVGAARGAAIGAARGRRITLDQGKTAVGALRGAVAGARAGTVAGLATAVRNPGFRAGALALSLGGALYGAYRGVQAGGQLGYAIGQRVDRAILPPAEVAKAAHDVSGEARDDHGRFASAGASAGKQIGALTGGLAGGALAAAAAPGAGRFIGGAVGARIGGRIGAARGALYGQGIATVVSPAIGGYAGGREGARVGEVIGRSAGAMVDRGVAAVQRLRSKAAGPTKAVPEALKGKKVLAGYRDRAGYQIHITDGVDPDERKYGRRGEIHVTNPKGKTVAGAFWMDFPEDHWGLSQADYDALPKEKRAAMEVQEQATRYNLADTYRFRANFHANAGASAREAAQSRSIPDRYAAWVKDNKRGGAPENARLGPQGTNSYIYHGAFGISPKAFAEVHGQDALNAVLDRPKASVATLERMRRKGSVAKASHDVSGEARDDHGRWTAEGGDSSGASRTPRNGARGVLRQGGRDLKDEAKRVVAATKVGAARAVVAAVKNAYRSATSVRVRRIQPVSGGGLLFTVTALDPTAANSHITARYQVMPGQLQRTVEVAGPVPRQAAAEARGLGRAPKVGETSVPIGTGTIGFLHHALKVMGIPEVPKQDKPLDVRVSRFGYGFDQQTAATGATTSTSNGASGAENERRHAMRNYERQAVVEISGGNQSTANTIGTYVSNVSTTYRAGDRYQSQAEWSTGYVIQGSKDWGRDMATGIPRGYVPAGPRGWQAKVQAGAINQWDPQKHQRNDRGQFTSNGSAPAAASTSAANTAAQTQPAKWRGQDFRFDGTTEDLNRQRAAIDQRLGPSPHHLGEQVYRGVRLPAVPEHVRTQHRLEVDRQIAAGVALGNVKVSTPQTQQPGHAVTAAPAGSTLHLTPQQSGGSIEHLHEQSAAEIHAAAHDFAVEHMGGEVDNLDRYETLHEKYARKRITQVTESSTKLDPEELTHLVDSHRRDQLANFASTSHQSALLRSRIGKSVWDESQHPRGGHGMFASVGSALAGVAQHPQLGRIKAKAQAIAAQIVGKARPLPGESVKQFATRMIAAHGPSVIAAAVDVADKGGANVSGHVETLVPHVVAYVRAMLGKVQKADLPPGAAVALDALLEAAIAKYEERPLAVPFEKFDPEQPRDKDGKWTGGGSGGGAVQQDTHQEQPESASRMAARAIGETVGTAGGWYLGAAAAAGLTIATKHPFIGTALPFAASSAGGALGAHLAVMLHDLIAGNPPRKDESRADFIDRLTGDLVNGDVAKAARRPRKLVLTPQQRALVRAAVGRAYDHHHAAKAA